MNRHCAGTQRTAGVVLGMMVNDRMEKQKTEQQDRDRSKKSRSPGESPPRAASQTIPIRQAIPHSPPIRLSTIRNNSLAHRDELSKAIKFVAGPKRPEASGGMPEKTDIPPTIDRLPSLFRRLFGLPRTRRVQSRVDHPLKRDRTGNQRLVRERHILILERIGFRPPGMIRRPLHRPFVNPLGRQRNI